MPSTDRRRPTSREAGLSLLFADDERSLQELMKLELPRMGHTVTVCPDGTDGGRGDREEQLRRDHRRPRHARLTGVEVIARLKELSPATEAVVLTGKSTTESAIAALRYGAFDYLTKPCKLVEIDALLQRIADEARADAEVPRAPAPAGARIEGAPKLVRR